MRIETCRRHYQTCDGVMYVCCSLIGPFIWVEEDFLDVVHGAWKTRRRFDVGPMPFFVFAGWKLVRLDHFGRERERFVRLVVETFIVTSDDTHVAEFLITTSTHLTIHVLC